MLTIKVAVPITFVVLVLLARVPGSQNIAIGSEFLYVTLRLVA